MHGFIGYRRKGCCSGSELLGGSMGYLFLPLSLPVSHSLPALCLCCLSVKKWKSLSLLSFNLIWLVPKVESVQTRPKLANITHSFELKEFRKEQVGKAYADKCLVMSSKYKVHIKFSPRSLEYDQSWWMGMAWACLVGLKRLIPRDDECIWSATWILPLVFKYKKHIQF